MKTRSILLLMIALLAMKANARAGDFSTGLFNSAKGFGLVLDYNSNPYICNSYILYADIYGMPLGKTQAPGLKLAYLHHNRVLGFAGDYADYGLYIAPGFSTGYVKDHGKSNPGVVTAADFALFLRMDTGRRLYLEFGLMSEIGLISRFSKTGAQVGLYSNGLRQSWYPNIKIMYRFK